MELTKDIIRLLVIKYFDAETAINFTTKICKRFWKWFTEKELILLRKNRARLSLKRLQEEHYSMRFNKLVGFKLGDFIHKEENCNKRTFLLCFKSYSHFVDNKMLRCPGCNNNIHKKGYLRHIRRGKCNKALKNYDWTYDRDYGCKNCDIKFTCSHNGYINTIHGKKCPMDETRLFSCPNITKMENLGFNNISYFDYWGCSTVYKTTSIANSKNVTILGDQRFSKEDDGCTFVGTLYEVKRHILFCTYKCLICDVTQTGDHDKHLLKHIPGLSYYDGTIRSKKVSMKCHNAYLGCEKEYEDSQSRSKCDCKNRIYKCTKCDENITTFQDIKYFSMDRHKCSKA